MAKISVSKSARAGHVKRLETTILIHMDVMGLSEMQTEAIKSILRAELWSWWGSLPTIEVIPDPEQEPPAENGE